MQEYTEAMVLSLVKTLKSRGMVSLFTEKLGKISAGAFLREKGRTASPLLPFTLGNFEINKSRDIFFINKAEVINSFYAIGENIDRYLSCSFVLEFTDKLLPEEAPAPRLFALLVEFFKLMEKRKKSFDPLVLAYLLKSMKIWGVVPELEFCGICGEKVMKPGCYSVRDGGIVCENCAKENDNTNNLVVDKLLYRINFDIVNVMRYLIENPLRHFENLALDEDISKSLRLLLRDHASYHLDIARLKT
jgi:DNA repair protein RecO (recombination protein O)